MLHRLCKCVGTYEVAAWARLDWPWCTSHRGHFRSPGHPSRRLLVQVAVWEPSPREAHGCR
eukprot:564160-Alexandrium_andersonii.AAC.1